MVGGWVVGRGCKWSGGWMWMVGWAESEWDVCGWWVGRWWVDMGWTGGWGVRGIVGGCV